MVSTVQDVKSIAASGTDVITVSLPSTGGIPQSLTVGLAAKYAAVSGTSGVTAAFQVSKDGTNWVASAVSGFEVAPAANALGYGEKKIFINGPLKLDGIPIVAVKITLTNTDAANAAVVGLVTETSDIL